MNESKELDYDKFMLVLQGHAAFQLVWAGIQLGLFEALSRNPGMSRAQIAESLNLDNQPTRILLVGLVAVGFLQKRGDSFSNATLVEKHLVGDRPDNLGAVLGWQHHIVYKGLVDFVESLKEGRNVGLRHFPGDGDTLYQRLVNQPAIEKIFQDAMSALSAQANRTLVEVLDLAGSRHLMDVGGGDGTNAIALASKFPDLMVTVFDSPSVCEIARKNVAAKELSARIDTYPGNLFTTAFPSDIDTILFCHMFTIWSPEENQRILRKSSDALPPGGRVIIFNMMGNDDDNGPMSTALGSPYFMAIATGKGMLYSWLDYQQWMEKAGFSRVERIEGLPLDHGVFIGVK